MTDSARISQSSYVLLGWPLRHSLSPVMHNAAFEHAGISARYELRPTAPGDLEAAVSELRSGLRAGANVTVPHKVAARALLDTESVTVAATGAVNTIVASAEGLHGENTDVAGFRHALASSNLPRGGAGSAVVLGAGGAARAVVYTLLRDGWQVTVLNRSSGGLGVLAGMMHRVFEAPSLSTAPLDPPRIAAASASADLLVNATTIGAHPNAMDSPWPEGRRLPSRLTVIDLVAWPVETRLVREARAIDADAHGGLSMLVGQAAEAWSLWVGHSAPVDTMLTAAREAIDSLS